MSKTIVSNGYGWQVPDDHEVGRFDTGEPWVRPPGGVLTIEDQGDGELVTHAE